MTARQGATGAWLARLRRYLHPATHAGRNIGVVVVAIGAKIPMDCSRCRGRVAPWNHRRKYGRLPGVGVGVNRRGIEVPSGPHHPPPAHAPVVAAMRPVPGAPQRPVLLMKARDVAMPAFAAALVGLVFVIVSQGRGAQHQSDQHGPKADSDASTKAENSLGRFHGVDFRVDKKCRITANRLSAGTRPRCLRQVTPSAVWPTRVAFLSSSRRRRCNHTIIGFYEGVTQLL